MTKTRHQFIFRFGKEQFQAVVDLFLKKSRFQTGSEMLASPELWNVDAVSNVALFLRQPHLFVADPSTYSFIVFSVETDAPGAASTIAWLAEAQLAAEEHETVDSLTAKRDLFVTYAGPLDVLRGLGHYDGFVQVWEFIEILAKGISNMY